MDVQMQRPFICIRQIQPQHPNPKMQIIGHVQIVVPSLLSLQELAIALLLAHWCRPSSTPLSRSTTAVRDIAGGRTALSLRRLPLPLLLLTYHSQDGLFEYLIDSSHLFTATLHVPRTHLPCYCLALFTGDGCQALCFEEVDARAFGAKVRFKTYENERCIRTEVENFGIPLVCVSLLSPGCFTVKRTLSITFSREFGQSIAKHTNRRSVSG